MLTDNHFDRDFGSLRPFADLGIANTISDTHFFVRPFTTLGIVSHFEGGATYRVIPFIRVVASVYDDLPSGQQKIFSKLKGRQSAAGFATRRHAGPFENAHETVGPADIARDNGYSLWAESSSLPVVHLEAGYTRSVHYALNTVRHLLQFRLQFVDLRHAAYAPPPGSSFDRAVAVLPGGSPRS